MTCSLLTPLAIKILKYNLSLFKAKQETMFHKHDSTEHSNRNTPHL